MAANSTDIISLTNNVQLEKTLEINKTVNINLNNHTIEADEKVFLVQGGSLNLSGKGKIKETKPNYGAIMLLGSDNSNQKDFTTISVGKDITLEGWSGIFINHNNNTAYGILVNMNGSINAINDTSGGTGIGIYVNGKIKHENNSPIINLSDTAKITSTGNGIYSAGYATYNINGAYISGKEAALGIKSGVFNILDGTIIGNGEDKTPTSGNNNGINASGTAIQIESNPGYKGEIELNIENGTIESKNSNAIYEYTTKNTSTKVKNIDLSGGKYITSNGKNVFSLSDSFKNTHQKFISGGSYSTNPSDYLETGYTITINENSMYEVIVSTMDVFAQKDKTKNNLILPITTVIIFLSLGLSIYFNRNKLIKLLKK